MNVVITGASQGIGFAIAAAFANAGYTLCLCSKTKANMDTAGNSLASKYPNATIHFTHADLSKKEQCTQFAQWCLDKGTPAILVNNAGFFSPGNIEDESDDALEQQMAVNLYSAYHTTRALLPAMLKMGKGHVFNICSIASLNAYAQGGSYSISKFALLGFSKNLRLELKDKGIKVTAVCPGAVYTNSWSGSGVDPNRIMESEDIAKMIFAAAHLSPQAVVEDIVMRPQKGDL
jgi:short-subunit dehydrogenase